MTEEILPILPVLLTDIEVHESWNARSGAWHENAADPTSDDGGFEGLKASMAIKGVNDTPVLLRIEPSTKDSSGLKYILVDGFRRMRAAKELGWIYIRATVEVMSEFEARRRNIQAQTSHERLKPADLAWALADLKRLGGPKVTHADLGTLVGVSPHYAGNLLRIMTEVDERVTAAWRASAVRVDPADLQRLTVLPRERHWGEWETLLLDKQTRPHRKTKATAFLRLKEKCREKGAEILQITCLLGEDGLTTHDTWKELVRVLFGIPRSFSEKEVDELADAMRTGYEGTKEP